MIRIFLFLLLVLLLGMGFAWFADRPGDVFLEWQGNRYQTSLMVVLVGMVALIASIMIVWWLGRALLDSPQIVSRFFKARRKDRGYHALSRGLIAANSGDAASARRYTKESIKLLGREPLVDLLDAQSALLEGKREDARKRFEQMLEDDETRLVALRGLYLEAERQGAKDAARHYAGQAHAEAPALPWAGNAKLRYACMDGDWEAALTALEANKSAGLIDKDTAKRQRAVLYTALAMVEEPADPVRAAKLAKDAHRLAPDLVPAAVIGARALSRNNDIARAAGMIETVWKKQPHPDLAYAYVHLRMGDSATDRLKRAKKLHAIKAHHVEGNYAIAEAAVDAQDWKLARQTLKSILTSQPTERACLLMADVEEGEFGDKGRMREWLSRAVRAPKDAAWTADGYVSDKWLPISPVSGRIDAFEWKVPVEQLSAPEAATLDAEGLEDLIREPETAPVVDKKEKPASANGASGAAKAASGTAIAITGKTDGKNDGKNDGIMADKEAGVEAEAKNDAAKDADTDGDVAASSEGALAEKRTGNAMADNGSDEAPSTETPSPETSSPETPSPAGDAASGQDKIIEAEPVKASAEKSDEAAPEAKPYKKTDDTAGNDKAGDKAADTAIPVASGPMIKPGADETGDNVPDDKPLFPFDRRPDDPGIDESFEEEKPKRFGIF